MSKTSGGDIAFIYEEKYMLLCPHKHYKGGFKSTIPMEWLNLGCPHCGTSLIISRNKHERTKVKL